MELVFADEKENALQIKICRALTIKIETRELTISWVPWEALTYIISQSLQTTQGTGHPFYR